MKNLNLNCGVFREYIVKRKEGNIFDIPVSALKFVINRNINEEVKYVFRFENDYGLSVIKAYCSYGYEDDLWEAAIIKFKEESNDIFDPIEEDVHGCLSDKEVVKLLREVKKYKKN